MAVVVVMVALEVAVVVVALEFVVIVVKVARSEENKWL